MINAVITCFRNYITFSGRATRSEFWLFILFLLLAITALIALNTLMFGPAATYQQVIGGPGQPVEGVLLHTRYSGGIFGKVFILATFLPFLAVGWRRMHDANRAGYLPYLLWLAWIIAVQAAAVFTVGIDIYIETLRETGEVIVHFSERVNALLMLAFIGILLMNFYWLTRPSDPGPNTYGPNPQEVQS